MAVTGEEAEVGEEAAVEGEGSDGTQQGAPIPTRLARYLLVALLVSRSSERTVVDAHLDGETFLRFKAGY